MINVISLLKFSKLLPTTSGVYFLCLLIPGGRDRLWKYAIEENYRATSRLGEENSGEALVTETTDWFWELLWDFRTRACHGFRTSRPSIFL